MHLLQRDALPTVCIVDAILSTYLMDERDHRGLAIEKAAEMLGRRLLMPETCKGVESTQHIILPMCECYEAVDKDDPNHQDHGHWILVWVDVPGRVITYINPYHPCAGVGLCLCWYVSLYMHVIHAIMIICHMLNPKLGSWCRCHLCIVASPHPMVSCHDALQVQPPPNGIISRVVEAMRLLYGQDTKWTVRSGVAAPNKFPAQAGNNSIDCGVFVIM